MKHAFGLVVVLSSGIASGTARADDLVFTDVTAEIGIDFVHERPAKGDLNNAHFYGGLAVADFDGDGSIDLFVAGSGSTHDSLYLNDGTGHFTDVSAAWGLDDVHFSCGVGAGDLDGDGWTDLVVASAGDASIPNGAPGGYRLYRNVGGTRFEDVAKLAGVAEVAPGSVQHPTFATTGDFNADGHLDLMYGAWKQQARGNRFYTNDGDGTFTDVTESMDFWGTVGNAKGFSASVVDMDGDLHPDILWVADHNKSAYFRNNGDGTFTNLVPDNGTGVDYSGMGSAVLDYNKDGRLDWFVGAIWYEEVPDGWEYNGNALYMQIADHQFINVAGAFGLIDSGWAWSSIAADLDHDGLEEIVVGNGHPSVEFREEREHLFQQQVMHGNYYNVVESCGLAIACEATSAAAFDLEGDGDLDLVFFCNGGPLQVYRNDTETSNAWLQIELGGDPASRIPLHGFNTRVEARVGDVTHVRYMDGNPSYGASGPLSLHFGLGETDVVDELTVRWINGEVDVYENVAVNQHLRVDPVRYAPGDLDRDGRVDGTDLAIMLSEWGPCPPPPSACLADLDGNGSVNGTDLAFVLADWSPAP